MHAIRLKRLRFSNILSYGNAVYEVVFDEEGGLTWVRGSNGSGKSTIIEALTFAFFGKAYRNINLIHLKNTANPGAKMWVEVDFDRIDSKSTDNYIIERTMSKSGSTSFNITINTEKEPKGAGTTQKKIEDEYLGFDKHIFENIISLNTINTKPIIDMEPKDKRKLIESILTLSIDKFKELNAKELSKAQTKFVSATSDVEKYMRDVHELQTIIVKMEQERANDLEELTSELHLLRGAKIDAETAINKMQTEYTAIVEEGKKIKAQYDKVGDVDSEIAALQSVKVLIPQYKSDKNDLEIAETEFIKCNETLQLLVDACIGHDVEHLTKAINERKESIRSIDRSMDKVKFEQTNESAKMDTIKKQVAELKIDVPCITCGKPSTEDDIEKIKASYRIEYKATLSKYTELTNQITELSNSMVTIRDEVDKLDADLTEASRLANLVSEYKTGEYQKASHKLTTCKELVIKKERQIASIGYDDISLIDDKLTELAELSTLRKSLNDSIISLRNEISVKKERINAESNIVNGLNERIKSLELKISDKQLLVNDDSLASTIKKLDNAKTDLDTARERVDKYSDRIAIKEYIKGMYNDTGIKKLILGIFIPNLNKAVSHNLTLFNLPYSIAFDDAMDIKFASRFGMAEVYDGLSEGQKRKINFAIAISFRDFVTAIADFKINLLFLDEVLDISTDMEALEDMIKLVKSKVSEIGNIYLITHRGDSFAEYFDECIEATNDGRYSSLSQFKMSGNGRRISSSNAGTSRNSLSKSMQSFMYGTSVEDGDN